MRLGIQKKLALSISTFLLIFFALSTWAIVVYTSQLTRENIEKQQFAMTGIIAGSIDDKLGSWLAVIADVASKVPPDISQNPQSAQKFLDERSGVCSIFTNGIMLFNLNLELVAESPFVEGRVVGAADVIAPFLRSVEKNGLPDISNPYISPKTNLPAIVMAATVTDKDDHTIGFLVGSINLTKDYFLEEMTNFKVGGKGYVYLFSKDRTMIVHPDLSRVMKRDIPEGANPLLDEAVLGFEGSGETVNTRGVKQLASYKRLRTVDWILGCVFPIEEAYAPVNKMQSYLISVSVITILASIVLIWILTSRITFNLKSFSDQVIKIKNSGDTSCKIDISGDDEVALLAESFNSMTVNLEEARYALLHFSTHDSLTGLYNRAYFDEEMERCTRGRNFPISIVIADLNGLKQVNDFYGHEAGDNLIKQAADLLHNSFRGDDVVARIGGDEFSVIMQNTSLDVAKDAIARIYLQIAEINTRETGGKMGHLSLALGVAEATDTGELKSAFKLADESMYEDKRRQKMKGVS